MINAKLLKERLWRQIESSKAPEHEDKENEEENSEEEEKLLYKTRFNNLFDGVQSDQACSPQACFVCLLHLANEKG